MYMHAIHTRLASLPLAPVRVVSEDMKCVGGGGPLLLLRPRRGLGAGGGPGLGPSCLLASSSRRKLGNSYLAGGGNPGSRDNTLGVCVNLLLSLHPPLWTRGGGGARSGRGRSSSSGCLKLERAGRGGGEEVWDSLASPGSAGGGARGLRARGGGRTVCNMTSYSVHYLVARGHGSDDEQSGQGSTHGAAGVGEGGVHHHPLPLLPVVAGVVAVPVLAGG